MSHALTAHFNFHAHLRLLDEASAVEVQRGRCPACEGRLDVANYPRKVRGLDVESEAAGGYARRFSLCCAREGCRKRATPPSVRFLGRRVFASVIFLLVALGQAGVHAGASSPSTTKPSWPTRKRWSWWWTRGLVLEPWFPLLAARLASPLDREHVAEDLMSRFEGDLAERVLRVLALLAPWARLSELPDAARIARVR